MGEQIYASVLRTDFILLWFLSSAIRALIYNSKLKSVLTMESLWLEIVFAELVASDVCTVLT